ncbi:hypothetical protein Adt_13525 [Abeliophyllum distichum]|uniref:Uncharacterized protein n=1 Tax=Abeliophyllum distichum TaxID=126358 RepID=A0ABD1TXL6_9LAMI
MGISSISECIQTIRSLPGIARGSPLYFYSILYMREEQNCALFVDMETDEEKLGLLQFLFDKSPTELHRWSPPLHPVNINSLQGENVMDSLFKPLNEERSDCPLSVHDIYKCPFLKNISTPTNFSFVSPDSYNPLNGNKGPIFEDGPNFDLAFKLFHGKDGVVPLSGKSQLCAPQFNPLAASISMSAFGPGGPFGFHSFFEKMKKQKSESSRKKENPKSKSSKHEAMGNEWLETGNCPIAKSYRAVSHVLPLVASALQPPPGMKIKCPPAVVAARAALARTAFVKTLRPQPLPEKMLAIGFLGIAG